MLAGSMPIDKEVYAQLRATKAFDEMDVDTDEVCWETCEIVRYVLKRPHE